MATSALYVASTSCPFIKTLSFVLHTSVRKNKVGPGVTEPLTGRHMSQIWFDKAQNSRVRPQQGTCVPGREGPVAPSASQHSPVCATNPNEAVLCGGKQGPVCRDLSEELNNQGEMQWSNPLAYTLTLRLTRTNQDWWDEASHTVFCRPRHGKGFMCPLRKSRHKIWTRKYRLICEWWPMTKYLFG